MAYINLDIIGVKGGDTKNLPNKGFVRVGIDYSDNYISVDAFQGSGDNYERRETSKITISNGYPEKTFHFNSFDELLEQLSK